MSKHLELYGKEYYEYIGLLSLGNVYYILISKRLLLKPIMVMWMYLFGLFLIRNNMFFAMVGLPSFVIFFCFLVIFFPMWRSCGFSKKAYVAFHGICILILKIVSIPISVLLEVLWTLCF